MRNCETCPMRSSAPVSHQEVLRSVRPSSAATSCSSASLSPGPIHRMICHMELMMKELYPLSGVMAIPQTPFDDEDRVDLDSFARGVADRLEAGVEALLYPVVASEVSRLTEPERRTLTLAVLEQAM